MLEVAFVLGNGESRKDIIIENLKKHGKVYACNAVYRTDQPDVLVAVDPKMMLEIATTEYMEHNVVWSNFNNQYKNNERIMKHAQFFQPSLGWSSGPTALKYATTFKPKEVYILGFDYHGHSEQQRKRFNNVFKDTPNYKRANEEATFFGNWMNQTKRVLKDNQDIQFYRVIPEGWFAPKDLEWQGNLTHINIDAFNSKFPVYK